MTIKFLKENLPWMVPSAALVFAASGYFDLGNRTNVTPAASVEQSAAASFVSQPVPTQAPAAQAVAVQDQVVTRGDNGISSNLVPLQAQPTFTDGQSNAVSSLNQQQPVRQVAQPSARVASFDQDPAAFFKDAQATLQAANSCKDDLKVLTSQARVYFPSGGLTAENAGLEQARLIGTVMQNCKGVGILVTGHSDPSGDPVVNQRLSQKRAELVIQRISASGMDTSSFVPQGFGDSRPSRVTGPKSRAYYDRRVEFSVVDLKTNVAFSTRPTQTFTPSCVSRLAEAVKETKLYYAPRSIAAPATEMDRVMNLAQQAAACPQARLRIIGHHTDEVWADENLHTGILRAKALMSILVGQGIASEEVIIAAPSRSIGVEGQPELSNSRVDFDIIVEPS